MTIMNLSNISTPAMLCQPLGMTRNHVFRIGGGTMAQILPAPARSLKEFRLLPGYTPADGRVQDIALETKFCRQGEGYLCVRTPFVSAAMQAVTGVDMAIAMAQLGGIGILPVSQTIAAQCA